MSYKYPRSPTKILPKRLMGKDIQIYHGKKKNKLGIQYLDKKKKNIGNTAGEEEKQGNPNPQNGKSGS